MVFGITAHVWLPPAETEEVRGRTALRVAEKAPSPIEFTALMRKVCVVPFVSPVTVYDRLVAATFLTVV